MSQLKPPSWRRIWRKTIVWMCVAFGFGILNVILSVRYNIILVPNSYFGVALIAITILYYVWASQDFRDYQKWVAGKKHTTSPAQ